MKIIKCDGKAVMALLEIMKIEPKCDFCGIEITEDNFGGFFLSNQVSCNNITCLIEVEM